MTYIYIGITLQKPLDYMKVTHLKHTAPGLLALH